MTTIYLKKNKEESLLRFHPWVFSGAIAHVRGDVEEGDVVAVRSSSGAELGVGHWQEGSIAVRILEFGCSSLPESFFHDRLEAAFSLRRISLVS